MKYNTIRNGLLLMAADLLGLFAAFNLANQFRFGFFIPLESEQLWVIILIALSAMYIMGIYRTENSATLSRLPFDALTAVIVAAMAVILFVYTRGVDEFVPIYGRGVLPVALAIFSLWLVVSRWYLNNRYTQSINVMTWYVIADQQTFEQFKLDCDVKYSDMKLIQLDPGLTELPGEFTSGHDNTGVIYIPQQIFEPALLAQLMHLKFSGKPIMSFSEIYEQFWMKLPVLQLKDGWFIQSPGFNLMHDHVGLRLKRVVDIGAAIIGIILAIPFVLVIPVLIRLDSQGQSIYSQERVGLNGKKFTIYKFRTMINEAEMEGAQWASVDDQRVTRIGKLLRITRLDEIPQLLNLLRGDMSLIGPRPERPEFVTQLEAEIPYYDLRHLVPPGITGWAQVMYRYGSTSDDAQRKLEYDLYYIKNHSIKLDVTIVLRTIFVILKGSGR